MTIGARSQTGAGGGSVDISELYRSQSDRLRRIAYLMTGEAEVADELVHDAFVRAHKRLEHAREPAAYLRATLVNVCLAWRGRRAMARERQPRAMATWVEPPEVDETWDLLRRLSPDQRVALVLRYYEDLPDDQIAEVMGCRPATVRTRIHRALNKLRKEMTP